MSSMTESSRPRAPSMALFTSRVSGIVAGWICSPCAAHSSATAFASGAVGTVNSAFSGVRIGLPSRVTR